VYYKASYSSPLLLLLLLPLPTTTCLADVLVEVNIEFEAVVSPRSELESTGLYVERELGDVDGTRAAKQRRRNPEHRSVALNHCHRVAKLLQPHVGTKATSSIAVTSPYDVIATLVV